MTRTTTPDQYTPVIRQLREARKAKRISAYVFAVAVGRIWGLRHG